MFMKKRDVWLESLNAKEDEFSQGREFSGRLHTRTGNELKTWTHYNIYCGKQKKRTSMTSLPATYTRKKTTTRLLVKLLEKKKKLRAQDYGLHRQEEKRSSVDEMKVYTYSTEKGYCSEYPIFVYKKEKGRGTNLTAYIYIRKRKGVKFPSSLHIPRREKLPFPICIYKKEKVRGTNLTAYVYKKVERSKIRFEFWVHIYKKTNIVKDPVWEWYIREN